MWWRFRRGDGDPWGLAGLWNIWIDKATGELVESYTMLTLNADVYPLMSRMHKPAPKLGRDQQETSSVVPIELHDVATWLFGSAEYKEALAACINGARTDGLERVFEAHRLDALIAPTEVLPWMIDFIRGDHFGASLCTPAAVAGYPHLTVPCGLVRGLPMGLSFVGRPWEEAKLLAYGHAYEHAAQARRAPRFVRRTTPV